MVPPRFKGCTGIGQVFTFAGVGWWNTVQVSMLSSQVHSKLYVQTVETNVNLSWSFLHPNVVLREILYGVCRFMTNILKRGGTMTSSDS